MVPPMSHPHPHTGLPIEPLLPQIQAALASGPNLVLEAPPGAGKTFTTAHLIVSLIRAGKRVGIASNSHKAIDNVLKAVEARLLKEGEPVRLLGQKKDSGDAYVGEGFVESVTDNAAVDPALPILGGTAWLFARPELRASRDVLFVDEAGQVSLGNLVNANETVLTNVVSMDPINFYFDVDERSYLAYQKLSTGSLRVSSDGNLNEVLVATSNEREPIHKGHMDFTDNRLDAASGTMRARAVFENKDLALVPGLFGRIRILGSDKYKGVLVPEDALGSDQDRRVRDECCHRHDRAPRSSGDRARPPRPRRCR